MALSPSEFEFLRQLIRKDAGIVLESGKEYLIETRLASVVRQHGLAGLSEIVSVLRARPFDPIRESIKEAMTTNETSFFRDIHPFEALRTTIIPELMKARAETRTLNLWCAAASSGQEPYSVMMLLRQHFPQLDGWTIRFLCTDLSREMIERCQSGRYSQLEVNRGLPAPMLVKHFRRQGSDWFIDEKLREPLQFRTMNLIEPWPTMPAMDLVMIRNVLIYFDLDTKRDILGRIRSLLRPDGYLVLGAAETTMNLDEGYERVAIGASSTYRVRRGAGPAPRPFLAPVAASAASASAAAALPPAAPPAAAPPAAAPPAATPRFGGAAPAPAPAVRPVVRPVTPSPVPVRPFGSAAGATPGGRWPRRPIQGEQPTGRPTSEPSA
jgi:chemotaxis protein methyltransferase CheR